MSLVDRIKAQLDRRGLRSVISPVVSILARRQDNGVRRIFYDDGVWIHDTSCGYFAYHQPYLCLNLAQLDEFARTVFFRGYTPRAGDVIMDVGAGVGEETLTFSRAVGEHGKVIGIEAHPRTFRCLQKLVQYNRLRNVLAIHRAVTEPGCRVAAIEDSSEYLRNRMGRGGKFSVPAATVDEIHRKLELGRIHFLKMNIEGAERLAVRGMTETLRQTEVLCVACHDFLADQSADDSLRTKSEVRQFFQRYGLTVVERPEPRLPPFVRDQVWAYNEPLMQEAAS